MKLVKTPVAVVGLVMMVVAAVTLVPRPTPVAADDHAGHELHEAMEEMNGLYRSIRRQTRDESQNADTVEKLHEMATLALAAKAHLPAMVADLPAAQQAELTATYRKLMNEVVVHLLTAENALLEGDNAAAWEAVLAANEVKGQGHELFIPEDE
ncbi:MAG: cytochrome b562 [Phycisphaerales bacterium JB063]